MPEPFLVVVALVAGAALGGAVAWALGASRARAGTEAALRDREARAAAAEARAAEIRQHLAMSERHAEALQHQLAEAQRATTAAETRVAEIEKHLAAQRALLDEARVKLADTFRALAAEALAGNNAGFLVLAEQKLSAMRDASTSDLESRQKAIEGLVQPLAETLSRYQAEARQLEERRLGELGSVGEQLRQLAQAQVALQGETARLVNALRSPSVRGRWGEIALRKTAELAGMSSHCDFSEQESVSTEDGRLRPDMIVRLPAGREVIVDSKVPLAAYLDALEAVTDEDRDAALARHAAQVRQHVAALASKEYWDQFAAAPEFVVLFIPNDSFLAAAAEKDPALVESALGRKVVIATPATFIALLRAIAYGWRQELVAENAQRISTLGQELCERLGVLVDHLAKVGGSLGRAVESYNAAVASLESRVLPSARKFKTLGVGVKRDIDELTPVDQTVRALGPGNSTD